MAANAQTDVTYKITNPDFESGDQGWVNSNLSSQTNSSFTQKHGTTYMEKWTSAGNSCAPASIKQTVKNLAKGKYRLTVAAQNIQQKSDAAQEGASIYAKSVLTKTIVTTAADYSVEFDLVASSTTIGFNAEKATGNWVCCDNFRLTFLSTTTENVQELIDAANAQLEKKLNDTAINALKKAIDEATSALTLEECSDLTGVANNLVDATVEAKAVTSAYSSLRSNTTKATQLVSQKMSAQIAKDLQDLIDKANAAQESTDNDPAVINSDLLSVMEKANESINAYKKLLTALEKAESYIDDSKKGGPEYSALVNGVRSNYDNGTYITTDEILAEITKLQNAQLEFNLANADENPTNVPEVTETNHYVVTGATEAMIRATYAGKDILEKGACWSTEHNPTVLDNRTTKSFSLNGTIIHIKGLEPATVYYVRPYVINNSYNVAYGDEVKVVTHLKGNCVGTWNEGAPTAEANNRCRKAINETIDYFNEWTGIKGFTLSGHYGADTPTADCSYGGWMRIGPKESYQAIGTVLHETGHGVGVGTRKIAYGYSTGCWDDTNVHNWKWYGREANKIYSFLENKEADPYNSDFCMVGDGTHGWGQSASYDWFVNGADKDKHQEFQYIGGCALLYGLFIDGLCPTDNDHNGIAGYTYNFDDNKKYYLMNKSTKGGLGEGLLMQRATSDIGWRPILLNAEEVTDSAAWNIEYNASTGQYYFKNVASGKYLTHVSNSTTIRLKEIKADSKPSSTEQFQLMPDRTDVTVGEGDNKIKTHGYWFTWYSNGNKAMAAKSMGSILDYGGVISGEFSYKDTSTEQQWIIISEDDIQAFHGIANPTAISTPEFSTPSTNNVVTHIYSVDGQPRQSLQKGINIIRYSNGSTKKMIVK